MQPVEASGSNDQQLADAIGSSPAEAVEETLMAGIIAKDGGLHWQVGVTVPLLAAQLFNALASLVLVASEMRKLAMWAVKQLRA
ncbi:hypothetical protein [Bifidobacterium asteroides]|uniref:hypothetical protein n=1 Tax=Bifidobacterium asteroides TaxID=1684 RepID=UPI001C699D38|nr:hypothetical protein [Bifidobacterium asteroides]